MSNVYRIPRGDITLGKFLDKGGFAEVFEGTRRGRAPVAVKRLFDGLSEQSKVSFRREVDMMCQLRSDFIVSVHGLVDDPPHEPMLLVMERMHENLVRAYGSVPAPSLRQRVEWLVQAGRGISFLHSQSPPILHRDIKPSNMLLTSPATGSRLKLSDLGLSKSLADITASLATRSTMPAAGGGSAAAAEVGTPHYKAPELMSLKPKYSPASDVYAFGVVCWETICMRLPYRGSSLQDIRAEVKAGNREDFDLEDYPDFVFPPALKAMIERAWAQDPKDRPLIEQCVLELQQYLAQLGAEAEEHQPSPASAALAPPASLIIDVQQHMASLTDVQVGLLVDNARPDFKTKGYGRAAVEKKVDGAFILEANEVELSMMFGKMNVDPVDMPAMRQAVSSWKANPAQVFSCINQAAQRAAAAEAQRRRDAEAAAAIQAQRRRNAQAAAANLGRYADPRNHVRHNGFIYASAHVHGVDGLKLYDGETPVDIDAGFEVAPGDASDVEVANAHAWGSSFLIFSDGRGAYSALDIPIYRSTLGVNLQGVKEQCSGPCGYLKVDSQRRVSTTSGNFEVLLRKRA